MVPAYRRREPAFPHHSTVTQQFFDDAMFEAYLALGEHVGEQLVSPMWWPGSDADRGRRVEDWLLAVAQRYTER